MNEIPLPDRPEFPLCEKARQRQRTRQPLNGGGIVIRLGEEARPTAIATEKERAGRARVVRVQILFEELGEILIGRFSVANVKLHRLPDTDAIPDRDRTIFLPEAKDI